MDLTQIMAVVGAQLVSRIPMFAVWVWGIVVASDRMKTHKESSQLILAGIATCIAAMLLSTAATVAPMLARESGRSLEDIGMLMSGVSIVTGLVSCAGWGLVLSGAFKAQSNTSRSAGA